MLSPPLRQMPGRRWRKSQLRSLGRTAPVRGKPERSGRARAHTRQALFICYEAMALKASTVSSQAGQHVGRLGVSHNLTCGQPGASVHPGWIHSQATKPAEIAQASKLVLQMRFSFQTCVLH